MAGAPGPSGAAPRIMPSWSPDSCSLMIARARFARSPKRRKTVPLPTPASAATASIVTHDGPSRSNSRAAASSTLPPVARGIRPLGRFGVDLWQFERDVEHY